MPRSCQRAALDAFAPNRDGNLHQHEVSLISQLLVLLDGLEKRGRVVVVATTNRIDAIDPAIRRPGRFDYHIEVPLPGEAGREAIVSTHLRKMKTSHHLDLARIAKATDGFSGADLAAVCREAGLTAIQRGLRDGIPAAELLIDQEDLMLGLAAIRKKRLRE